MKKVIAALMLICTMYIAKAQEPTQGLTSNQLATEVQFNMTNGWFGNIVLPSIRFRYGINNKWYLRADIDGTVSSNKSSAFENMDNTGNEGTSNTKNSSFSFGLGGEYHLASYKKISPFVGMQIGVNKTEYKREQNEVKNGIYVPDYAYLNERSSIGAEAYVFTGFDFWVYPRLYIGTEFGINFTQTWQGETKISTTESGVTTDNNRAPSTQFNVSKVVNPAIRIGYVLFD